MNFLDDFTAWDFETTGTDFFEDRVLEMAAVRYVGMEPKATFTALVAYDGEIPAKATEVHGITRADVANAIDENCAFRGLLNFCNGSTLVAHNAGFDLGMWHGTRLRLGAIVPMQLPFLCTLTIARKYMPYPHTLGKCCERLGVQLSGAHRALNDVQATASVLLNMHAKGWVTEEDVNRLGYLRKYGPNAWVPPHATLLAQ